MTQISKFYLKALNSLALKFSDKSNIGGSFIASTANSINFSDGIKFSAVNSQTSPLLTISVPVGLQFGSNPGNIVVRGNGYNLSVPTPLFSPITVGNNSTGLQVSPGKTLALVGGNVDLQGSTLTAEQGRIELGSIADGQVSLSPIPVGFALSYQSVHSLQDIRLSQQALANASGGSIQVQGHNISLIDGSLILSQNHGDQFGGSLSVDAAQSLKVSGTNPNGRLNGGLRSETIGSGSGANIAIATKQLIAQGGAAIVTRSFSPAQAGNVAVNASDSIQVNGVSPLEPTVLSAISAIGLNSGKAGDVALSTKRLTVLNGGAIASSALGSGNGGEVTVNALDSVELIGMSRIFLLSAVNALAASAGDAGKVTINTSSLVIRSGGAVSSATFGTGNAGSITINAKESVEVRGTGLNSRYTSSVRSSAPILAQTVQQAYRLPPTASGASGDVTINTGTLRVTDNATVEVSNQGLGNSGNLRIQANSIFLDRGGAITAASAFGEGGNIELQAQDLLLLRRNSGITASARGRGNGGNININTNILVALANSDISANSIDFRGGNVRINAKAIIGTRFRDAPTPKSDITATGANPQFNGVVQVNTPDVDPSQGLTALPTNIIDSSQLIANSCIASSKRPEGKFFITGNGGLPIMPDDPQVASYQTYQIPSGINADISTPQENTAIDNKHELVTPLPLIPATGWIYGSDGNVSLISSAPNVAPGGAWPQHRTCSSN
ncbi:S-layer family protein [Nostoc sp. FACHB-152]|nr:S-layer family protein [Nostoc sp. FACHB-152]